MKTETSVNSGLETKGLEPIIDLKLTVKPNIQKADIKR